MTEIANLDRVCVVGLGYIGLPTAAMLANHGVEVIGVDIDHALVESINQGQLRVVEPELQALLDSALLGSKLRATTMPEPADAFLIAVPTPLTADKRPDLQHLRAAVLAIGPYLKPADLLIVESTSPVGTCQQVLEWLAALRPDLHLPNLGGEAGEIYLAYCPERVLPGQIVGELRHTDRVVGGITRACAERAADLYRRFADGELWLTDARTAEMVKLAENAFRDVNIAYANELSMLCDRAGIDVWQVIRLANRHPRVEILQPGCGVGGHCIAVDPWFIVDQAPDLSRLIRTARLVNDDKTDWLLQKVEQAIAELNLGAAELSIACFGLSYKPDSDDLRESPALKIATHLAKKYPGRVRVVEPYLRQLPTALAELGVELVAIPDGLACRIILRLVEHRQFVGVSWPINSWQKRIGGRAECDPSP